MQPEDAGALTAHACLLRLRGHYREAGATLARSLAITRAFAPSAVEMARLARHDGLPARAHEWYEDAHRLAPDDDVWLDEWVELLWEMQRMDEAVQVATWLCEARPDSAKSWFLLGLSQQKKNAHTAALDAYQRAMTLDASYPVLRNNLAAVHYSLGELELSLRICEEAIRADPGSSLPWTNASNAWLALREPGNALIAAERACALTPAYVPALMVLNNALKELQRWDDAFAVVQRAARVAPEDQAVKWSIAMLQLLRGDDENGWQNHEARWAGSPELRNTPSFLEDRRWRGEDLAGKTLLVWGEQGFGDAFQFVRFVPWIAQRMRDVGGTVIYCCFAKQLPLFERMLKPHGVRVVPHDSKRLPEFNVHLPVGSLPLMLGVRVETQAAPLRYLEPDSSCVARWGKKLPQDGRLKVGLVWSGSRTHQRNPLRSVPPALYAETFADLPGIEFHSLQIDGADELAAMSSQGLTVVDHTAELTSFDETAALICNLDLVITVCTSLAHLAGALGTATWLLLDVNPHWVWMLKRSDSPWYPALTLYRQEDYMEWSPVLQRVRADLLNLRP
ncbi:tetratricopeptide repeat protein [Paraburkholderia dilworthii]|uniref:Tetratricopeptide repeat protein n=1 Tax=Paraburkholderia dilworthii TaxID=948106 RepID=A0ABW9DHJ8_9BURK